MDIPDEDRAAPFTRHPPMRRLAHHLIRSLNFVAFGAFCTVAVAIFLVLAPSDWFDVDPFDTDRERVGGSRAMMFGREAPGEVPADYWGWLIFEYRSARGLDIHSSWTGANVGGGGSGGWPEDPAEPLVPSWGQFVSPIGNTARDANHAAAAVSRGWPLPALSGGFLIRWRADWIPEVTKYSSVLLDPIEPGDLNSWMSVRVIPLRPLPLGFLVNTAVYALAGWIVMTVPPTIRRSIRRRRGLCPQCGHTLAGVTRCPECGVATVQHQRSTGTA